VKQTLTKSALINLLVEENEIPRKTMAGVYATLENLFLGPTARRVRVSRAFERQPAQSSRPQSRTLVRNPSTGEMVKAAAKPASVGVKIRALSKLKTAATS
jgi:hypothetical protein